jgi:hypothetical protein
MVGVNARRSPPQHVDRLLQDARQLSI